MMGGSFAVCALGGCGSFAGCALGGYQSRSLRQLICRAATHLEAGKKHVEAEGRQKKIEVYLRSSNSKAQASLAYLLFCVGIWVGSLGYNRTSWQLPLLVLRARSLRSLWGSSRILGKVALGSSRLGILGHTVG
jgi:hypothetical protein